MAIYSAFAKNIIRKPILLYLTCLYVFFPNSILSEEMSSFVIVTAADERFFPCLLNFIGGIHKVNFDDLGEIAVFDLGLTSEQRLYLGNIAKINIYSVEMTHPDLVKNFVTRPCGRIARGWYAWKPVIIKQALDMFPEILYIDSGILILNPLNNLFKHIHKHGYFLLDCAHSIEIMTTDYVIEQFDLHSNDRQWILNQNTFGISAGFQGLTHQLYNDYVLPMYEHSKNLRLFIDDGTAPGGFGNAREDQLLFSIYARLLHLNIFPLYSRNNIDGDVPATYTMYADFITGGLENLSNRPDLKPYIRFKS